MAVQPSAETVNPAPAPDFDEIVRVIQLYIDGFNQADRGQIPRVFPGECLVGLHDDGRQPGATSGRGIAGRMGR